MIVITKEGNPISKKTRIQLPCLDCLVKWCFSGFSYRIFDSLDRQMERKPVIFSPRRKNKIHPNCRHNEQFRSEFIFKPINAR